MMRKYNIRSIWMYLNNIMIGKLLQCTNRFCWALLIPFIFELRGKKANCNFLRVYKFIQSEKPKKVMLSSTDCLNVLGEKSFYKIPLTLEGDNRLKAEYASWCTIRKNKVISDLFSSELECLFLDENKIILSMPIYQKVEKERVIPVGLEMLECFRKNASTEPASITEYMNRGLCILKKEFNNRVYDKYFSNIDLYLKEWKNKQVQIGFVHGDFHGDNILIYNGKYIIIDTDRCQQSGIQLFDVIHYLIWIERTNQSWMECLESMKGIKTNKLQKVECLEEYINPGLLDKCTKIAYWIDRIGKENADNKRLTQAQKYQINKFFKYIGG